MQNHPTQVALITGAARRIGAEIARVLHAANMNVIIHYHTSGSDAQALCAELNAKRPNSAITLAADLTNISVFQSLIEESVKAWGRLDVLINNASRFYKSQIGDVSEAHWDDLLTSNLKAPFFLAQTARPYLQKNRGSIVNIADIHAEKPVVDYSVYCISKAGLVMLTKSLAKELGPDIRVNAVSPGAIAWPEGENTLSQALQEKIVQSTVLKRHGEPGDIANAVLFLIRDANYITGQVLAVDGGRML